jgi:hypothetical protein
MQTADGYLITTIEQEGTHAGEDLGRIWVDDGQLWTRYDDFACEAQRQAVLVVAQTMTAWAFDHWFDTIEPPERGGRKPAAEEQDNVATP